MTNVVLHIGYEKTGTTTLQKHLFTKLDDVYYVGRLGENYFIDLIDCIQGRLGVDEIRRRWADVIAGRPSGTHTVLYSREGITSTHLSEQEEMARRLHDVFGDARALLTIRRQEAISVSRYFNSAANGYTLESFDSYMRRGIDIIGNDYSNDDVSGYKIPGPYARDQAEVWSAWQYAKLVATWSEYFSDINVLPLELWGHDIDRAVRQLSDVLDVEEGGGGVFIPEKKEKSRSGGQTVDLSRGQRKEIQRVYGPENSLLSERYRLDLEELGYSIGTISSASNSQ